MDWLNKEYVDLAGLEGKARFMPYTYGASHASIAAGSTQQGSIKIDGDSAFVVDTRIFNAFIVAASGSSIAGTPLPREPMADSAGNELPPLRQISILITVNARRVMNAAVPADLWTGTGTQPGYPLRKLWIPRGATLFYEITNGTAATAVGCYIGFDGARVYPN